MGDKTDRVTGQVKEKAGKAAGDPNLEQRGRNEQTKGNVKRGAKDIKDAVKKQL
jgi:uncharacterized protein YjbJ (UPF0337 family)